MFLIFKCSAAKKKKILLSASKLKYQTELVNLIHDWEHSYLFKKYSD